MRMSGPAWIAKDGVGVAEYKAAQKAFSDVGHVDIASGAGAAGQGDGGGRPRRSAEAGVVIEQENQMTMEGTGQMAQMMGQMGGMTITTKVTAITTDPIPDSKFALPEGYTKK